MQIKEIQVNKNILLTNHFKKKVIAISLDNDRIFGSVYKTGNQQFDYIRMCTDTSAVSLPIELFDCTGLSAYNTISLITYGDDFVIQSPNETFRKKITRKVPKHDFKPTHPLLYSNSTQIIKNPDALLPLLWRKKLNISKSGSESIVTVNSHDRCCLEIRTATSYEIQQIMKYESIRKIYNNNFCDFDGLQYISANFYQRLKLPFGFTGYHSSENYDIECWFNDVNNSIVIEQPKKKSYQTLCNTCKKKMEI